MTKSPPPPESHDKAEDDESPMAKFTKLAKGILSITPDQLKAEQARYDDRAVNKKRPRLKSNI